jgi:hypothetical protein
VRNNVFGGRDKANLHVTVARPSYSHEVLAGLIESAQSDRGIKTDCALDLLDLKANAHRAKMQLLSDARKGQSLGSFAKDLQPPTVTFIVIVPA